MPQQAHGGDPYTERCDTQRVGTVIDDEERVAGVTQNAGAKTKVTHKEDKLVKKNDRKPDRDHGRRQGASLPPKQYATCHKDRIGNGGKE